MFNILLVFKIFKKFLTLVFLTAPNAAKGPHCEETSPIYTNHSIFIAALVQLRFKQLFTL